MRFRVPVIYTIGLIAGALLSTADADDRIRPAERSGYGDAMMGLLAKVKKTAWMQFVPPVRGAPKSRIAAGTRSSPERNGTVKPYLTILAPEETGFTISDQPTVYWFVSKKPENKVIASVIDLSSGGAPLLRTDIVTPLREGINALNLKDHGVRLNPKTDYLISVRVVVGNKPGHGDVAASAYIRYENVRIPDTDAAESDVDAAQRLAVNGIWYDALHRLSKAIQSAPTEFQLREYRASLFEQVDLQPAAEYELKR